MQEFGKRQLPIMAFLMLLSCLKDQTGRAEDSNTDDEKVSTLMPGQAASCRAARLLQ